MDDRRVELDYVFDRLGEAQRVEVYRLLVPPRRRRTREGGQHDEHGGDLRTGVFGPPERGADHRESDCGVADARERGGTGGPRRNGCSKMKGIRVPR